jgi:hypothetical protein
MKSRTTLFSAIAAIALAVILPTQQARAFVTVTVVPSSQIALVGSNVVFNAQVATSAGETITGYAWLVSTNGGSSYTTVAGAINATLTLPNVQLANAGLYYAQVTYSSGASTGLISASTAVSLTVYDQARIVTQPVGGLARLVGSNVSFTVTAAGSAPLVYQWRLNGANLSDNIRIAGTTTATLAITNLVLADSGSYDVIVTNIYSSATSHVATLTVLVPPAITAQPQPIAVILGSNAVFSVTATGTAPLSYVWNKDGKTLSNGGRISGANTNNLTISAVTTNDAGGYSLLIANSVGSITSSVAGLTVLVPPTITSPTNVAGRQGAFLTFTVTATGTTPITFGSGSLPTGLTLEPTSGVIAGIPLVTGIFNVTLYATNTAMTTTEQLTLALTTGVPGINSSLSVSGKQGQNFSYGISASNSPVVFTASTLPTGLNLDPVAGTISGAPIVNGIFQVTISAGNEFGTDTEVLTFTIVSSLPAITSALTATGTEGQTNFSYQIRATESPTDYGASNLPLGLSINTSNGIISGTPWQGGTFTIPIWANNAWGTGTTNLVLTVGFAPISGLAIMNVTPTYSKPYVLDFSFTLRDGPDPVTNNAIVLPITNFQILCMEDGVPISSEAPLILASAANSKQLKTCLVLDYTYSMLVVPGAIDAMEAAAGLLINDQPTHALFGVVEFNAEYVTPQFVTNKLTSPNNFFITDKTVLNQSIAGIRTNYVKGNYAGSRCWDAINIALNGFGPGNPDEQRYLVAMTDGNDDASVIGQPNPVGAIIKLAQKTGVKIYCVAFGANVNTNTLQQITSQTGGYYYLAATTADLGAQFQRIQNEVGSQYILRWATLQRATVPGFSDAYTNLPNGFQPSFQISCAGFTDSWNTAIVTTTWDEVDTNSTPPTTNTITANLTQFPFNPPDWTNDVRVGSLRLAQDADVGPQTIRLRTTYTPRFVREIKINYRPNYPCTAVLDSTGADGILNGWSMTETTDTNGLRTLTLMSSDTNNPLTSIPYAAFGDMVEFDFTYPDALTTNQAFSVLSVDNSIYTNVVPSGLSFTNQNFNGFVTLYPPPPPYGTPIPWLTFYGFKTNFAAAELIATNGLPVWQDYIAGLNPTNAASQFGVWPLFLPGQTPQILFSTVVGRTYRLETATSLTNWTVLRDNMPGTGGNILYIDNRNLSGLQSVFYRVGVY